MLFVGLGKLKNLTSFFTDRCVLSGVINSLKIEIGFFRKQSFLEISKHEFFIFREKIKFEQAKYDDILQVDMIDHYNNLTLKSVFTLKFFLNESNFDEPPPYHIMKIDNDAYLNLPQLVKVLKDPKLKKTDMYLVGHRYALLFIIFKKIHFYFIFKNKPSQVSIYLIFSK